MKKLLVLILLVFSLQGFSQYKYKNQTNSGLVMLSAGAVWTTLAITTQPIERWVPDNTSNNPQAGGYANGGPVHQSQGNWEPKDPWRNVAIGVGITITITGLITTIIQNKR